MDSETMEQDVFMTPEGARAVLWIGPRKPMGELYDSGYLTKSRLEWGRNRAYSPSVRAASVVFLKKKEAELAALARKNGIPKTVDEARMVVWPFHTRGARVGLPVGELLDARELGKKDLGFAMDAAWDERLRSAARILLSEILRVETEKALAPAGALKVFSNRSYMAMKREFISLRKGMFLGGSIVVLLLIVGVDIFWYMPKENWKNFFETLGAMFSHPFSAAVVTLFLCMWAGLLFIGIKFLSRLVDKLVDRYDSKIEDYRKGEEGEDRAVEAMRETLDGSCCVFRDLVLPGVKGKTSDMDAVLVSPRGIFVFEVKNWKGEYENEGNDWFIRKGKKRKAVRKSPSKQCLDNARRLADFLSADFNRNGDVKWVEPIVVMADPDVVFYETKPGVPIWRVEHLSEELGDLQGRHAVSEKTRHDVCERLKKFYEKDHACALG